MVYDAAIMKLNEIGVPYCPFAKLVRYGSSRRYSRDEAPRKGTLCHGLKQMLGIFGRKVCSIKENAEEGCVVVHVCRIVTGTVWCFYTKLAVRVSWSSTFLSVAARSSAALLSECTSVASTSSDTVYARPCSTATFLKY